MLTTENVKITSTDYDVKRDVKLLKKFNQNKDIAIATPLEYYHERVCSTVCK